MTRRKGQAIGLKNSTKFADILSMTHPKVAPWPEGPYRHCSGFSRVPKFEVGTSVSYCFPAPQYEAFNHEQNARTGKMMCLAPQMAKAIMDENPAELARLKMMLTEIADGAHWELFEEQTALIVKRFLDGTETEVARVKIRRERAKNKWRQAIVDLAGQFNVEFITDRDGDKQDLYHFLQCKTGPLVRG